MAAKKARKTNLEVTPLMALAMMTMFVMMVPLVSLAKPTQKADVAGRADMPTPAPELMEY